MAADAGFQFRSVSALTIIVLKKNVLMWFRAEIKGGVLV
jgi:hypothetical protein